MDVINEALADLRKAQGTVPGIDIKRYEIAFRALQNVVSSAHGVVAANGMSSEAVAQSIEHLDDTLTILDSLK